MYIAWTLKVLINNLSDLEVTMPRSILTIAISFTFHEQLFSCGASMGRGNEILFGASGSHDQDDRHAHIYGKNRSKIFFSGTKGPMTLCLGM